MSVARIPISLKLLMLHFYNNRFIAPTSTLRSRQKHLTPFFQWVKSIRRSSHLPLSHLLRKVLRSFESSVDGRAGPNAASSLPHPLICYPLFWSPLSGPAKVDSLPISPRNPTVSGHATYEYPHPSNEHLNRSVMTIPNCFTHTCPFIPVSAFIYSP